MTISKKVVNGVDRGHTTATHRMVQQWLVLH